jgi:hypothetical protein
MSLDVESAGSTVPNAKETQKNMLARKFIVKKRYPLEGRMKITGGSDDEEENPRRFWNPKHKGTYIIMPGRCAAGPDTQRKRKKNKG